MNIKTAIIFSLRSLAEARNNDYIHSDYSIMMELSIESNLTRDELSTRSKMPRTTVDQRVRLLLAENIIIVTREKKRASSNQPILFYSLTNKGQSKVSNWIIEANQYIITPTK